MSNDSLRYGEIAILLTDEAKNKCINFLGESLYYFSFEEKYIILDIKSGNWFSCDPIDFDNLAVITEVQFDYVLHLHTIGISLDSVHIQEYIKHCVELKNE